MNLINRFTVKSFLHLFLLGLLIAGMVGFNIYGQGQSVHADTPVSPWLAAEAPELTNLKTNVGFDEIPQHIDGNQECLTKQSFFVRPSKPWQSEQSYVACGVDTAYGTVDRSVLNLVRTGTHIAGPVYDQYGRKLKLYPIPNSDTAITYSSAPSGLYITLQRDVSKHLSTEVDSSGKVSHTLDLSSTVNQLIRDKLSKPVDARLDTAASSGNGKWMVFDYSYVGLVRLNVETGEIFIFAPGYKYNIGRDPALNLAISGDGRYVAESSSPYSIFRIHDLNTCVEADKPNKPADCQYRDLRQALKDKNPNQIGTPNYISFTDDYTLKFYGTTVKDSVKERHIQLLSAYSHSPVEFSYLALGDSFASGEGAFSYKAGTDEKSPLNKCHLSVNSYPYLLGAQLNLNDYESIACSGAKIKDINSQGIEDYNHDKKGRQAKEKEDPPFDNEIYKNFLPGYRVQKEFVERYHPDKLTISISGNDMGFGNIVRNCVFWYSDCYASDYERAVIVKTVDDRFDELVAVYNQLKESSPATTIYAIGYPKLVNPEGTCDTNVHASREELRFFDSLEGYINSVIKKAADRAGVYYVDVSDALAGNRLCESNGHEPAVNGLTAGNDKLFDIGPIGNESYHPNALGHALLEKAILQKTDNFSAKNPAPKEVETPKISDAQDFIGGAEFNDFDVRVFMTDTGSWWYESQKQDVEQEGFMPDSDVHVTVTSDPLSLGSFQADDNGVFSTNLSLPDSFPVGYHTLHISGQNIAGEKVEYQKPIFVAYSENDYDGDGIANEDEPCLAIPPSGLDYDQDGVDDACDERIGEPSAPEPVNDVVPLPGFGHSDDSGADIIDSVNEGQNQNSTYVQPQEGGGIQSQSASVPVSSTNTNVQGQSADLFGNNSNTASLLNQTQVLGTSAPAKPQENTVARAANDPSPSIPVTGIAVAFVLVVVFALFFRWLDSKEARENVEED